MNTNTQDPYTDTPYCCKQHETLHLFVTRALLIHTCDHVMASTIGRLVCVNHQNVNSFAICHLFLLDSSLKYVEYQVGLYVSSLHSRMSLMCNETAIHKSYA